DPQTDHFADHLIRRCFRIFLRNTDQDKVSFSDLSHSLASDGNGSFFYSLNHKSHAVSSFFFSPMRSWIITIARTASGMLCRTRSPCPAAGRNAFRSEEHTSELQSRFDLVCRLLLEKKK